MVFSRLFPLILLTILVSNISLAQSERPSPEAWVGKKPSELLDDPYVSNGKMDFFDSIEDNGMVGPFITWPYKHDKFIKTEQPVLRIDQYLVFWANDCGDKICKEGIAFVYDTKNDTKILCEHKRGGIRYADNDMYPEPLIIYQDTVTVFVLERRKVHEIYSPKITKTGENLSCGGGQEQLANAEAIVRQLVWIAHLIYASY